MADLITLSELKAALNIDPTDDRRDSTYTTMIPWASDAVRAFTERDFGSPSVTEVRTFQYDGSGYLDIDDASAITQVAFSIPNTADLVLDPELWYAAPQRRDDAPIYYYIVFTVNGYSLGSPEMGFVRNLDVLAAEGRLVQYTRTAKVTGTWGWPDIPSLVKLAMVWTLVDWTTNSAAEGLTAEAIAGFSRSWGQRAGGMNLAVPNRAKDLLANFMKYEA